MAKDNPITGPFPDGDSRNITLTRSSNSIEPDRTGPQEPDHRKDGAPETIMGDLPTHKGDPDVSEPDVSEDNITPRPTGENPALRARADANRPLIKD